MSTLSAILRDAVSPETSDRYLSFWCPGCDEAHVLRVSGAGRPCWTWNGNAERPTFSPSILVTYTHWEPPAPTDQPQTAVTDVCHSFVRDGQIQFLGDCTHKLAGQTVPLPEWPA